ncbi:MAG: hypothetical protein JNM63_07040 [Spirochaetia bacterium]|nr:hypothetical protein [Spirochaetia bacterium]
MLSMMPAERVNVSARDVGWTDNDDIGVLASRKQGLLAVLCWNNFIHKREVRSLDTKMILKIGGLAAIFPGNKKIWIRTYVIDEKTSNLYHLKVNDLPIDGSENLQMVSQKEVSLDGDTLALTWELKKESVVFFEIADAAREWPKRPTLFYSVPKTTEQFQRLSKDEQEEMRNMGYQK